MIHIQDVVKNFGNIRALDSITLHIKPGEFFGLLGPNGAGKTTLMNLITGYISPDSGSINLNGEKVSAGNLDFRYMIGVVPQSIALYDDLSALENLHIFGSLYHIKKSLLEQRIDELLTSVGLHTRRKDKVTTYSGGMKRRLNICAGLLHDPPVFLCDEPTVGVDPQSRNAIFDYLIELNRSGKTIIYSTHYMEEAEKLCSRIAIIDRGTIIAKGTQKELIHQLPFDQTISVTKTSATTAKKNVFEEFGSVHEINDHYELKTDDGILLSDFFAKMEQEEIPYTAIDVKRPSLEMLFLHLTGRRMRD